MFLRRLIGGLAMFIIETNQWAGNGKGDFATFSMLYYVRLRFLTIILRENVIKFKYFAKSLSCL